MSSTQYLPGKEADLLAWALNASTVLAGNPTGYGQTSAVATQLTAKVTAFENAMTAWTTPETRTPVALETKRVAKTAMIDFVRPLVRQIQASPLVTDPMRTAMRITVPKIPSPPENPGTPTNFKVELTAIGSLNLSWKCTNPTAGTMYQVFRKIGDAEATYIGGCGGKKFVDDTVPAGTAQITYQIQAIRSTAVGAWATFVVNIGVAGSGAISAVVSNDTGVKIAA